VSRQLTVEHEMLIERIIETGEYSDANQVLNEALQLLEEQARLSALRRKLQIGLESVPPIPITPEFWDRLEAESEAAYLRGELPDPGV
jgi:putative addiction module CopG family antidote